MVLCGTFNELDTKNLQDQLHLQAYHHCFFENQLRRWVGKTVKKYEKI